MQNNSRTRLATPRHKRLSSRFFARAVRKLRFWPPSESWLVNSKFTCVNRSKVMTIKKYFILYSNVLFKKTFQGQSFSLFVILREYGVRMEATCEKDVIYSLTFLSYLPSLGPVECWPRTEKQLKKSKPILTYVWGYGGYVWEINDFIFSFAFHSYKPSFRAFDSWPRTGKEL